MALRDYVIGVLQMAWIWGGSVVVGLLLVRALADSLSGSARAAAVGLIACAAMVVVHLIPGMLTILSPLSVAVTMGVALAGSAWLVRRRHGLTADREPARPAPPSSVISWAFAAVAWLFVAGNATSNMWSHRAIAPIDTDLNGIHLPEVVSWMQTHSMWGNHNFVPFYAAGNYPQNVDIPYLSTLLPLHQDVFARSVVIPFYALLGLMVYAFARELQSPRATAALLAAAVLAMRVVAGTTFINALPDAQMLACTGAGALFLARHHRTGARSDLALAGVGLGVAMGGKWYGVPTVVALLVAWMVVRFFFQQRSRKIVTDAATASAWILLFGGFWLLRNWVTTGNPLFPQPVRLFGHSLFDVPPDPVRKLLNGEIKDYLTNSEVMRKVLIPAWRKALGSPGEYILFLGAPAAVLWIVQQRRKLAPSPAIATMILGALLCIAAYCVTPYSANGPAGHPLIGVVGANVRYVAPAFVVLAGPGAWLIGRLPMLPRLAAEALAAVFTVLTVRSSMVNGSVIPGPSHLHAFYAVVLLAAVAFFIARAVIPRSLQQPATLLAIGVAALAIVVVGRRAQRSEAYNRYSSEPAIAAIQKLPKGSKIALAGFWDIYGIQLTYPLFGPRLDTHIAYVGHYDRGGLRPVGRKTWEAKLNSGRYDLLAIGVAQKKPDYEAWAREAGWGEIKAASDPRTLLMLPPGG